MSSELERRLEGLLAAAPEPEAGAGEEALARALSALQPAAPGRRGLRTAVLVFAAAVVLLAIAAGSLAAAGALHVSFGAKTKHHPAPTELLLPQGANGIVALVDGRLSVVIKGGFRLQGLRATAAALSPHALYVAAGIGRSLVAMAPDGRRAWSHPAGGRVVTLAWAPDGLRIAYVMRRGHHFALHVIWGNGTHDATIDRSVRAVRPSWRADSLALAYVGAGGRAVVYDLAHASRRLVPRSAAVAPVRQLAFARSGAQLALSGAHGFLVGDPGGRMYVGHRPVRGIGWLGDEPVTVEGSRRTILRVDPQSTAIPPRRLPGRAVGFDSNGYGFVVALRRRGSVELLADTGTGRQLVLQLPQRSSVGDLAIG